MNEVIKSLKERRSIHKFKPEMPKKEDLEQIIEAGLYAANGGGKQGTIIVAVTNQEIRNRLCEVNGKIAGAPEGFDVFYGGQAILIVLADKNNPNKQYDGALTMGNMLNAAHALGLGSIWVHRAKEEFETDEWKKLLADIGVEGEWEGVGHCVVGYVDGEYPEAAERKPNRVFWVE